MLGLVVTACDGGDASTREPGHGCDAIGSGPCRRGSRWRALSARRGRSVQEEASPPPAYWGPGGLRGLGRADQEAKIAAGCDTVYDIMSMTKQFTAAGILRLEMLGRLELSDPISKHLGPVPNGKRDVTVHHLLTHTAGLRDSLGGDYERLSRDQMVRKALRSKLVSAPGEQPRRSSQGGSTP